MTRGYLITFEGGEGTGKSCQLRRLEQHLAGRGHTTVCTREPGGTELAEAIRGILLGPGHDPDGLSELFLLAAARHDHVRRVIRPALEAGKVVLSDRFADSSVVYQGFVRGVGEEEVERVNRLATGGVVSDLTLVLDLEPEVALERVRVRNQAGSGETRLDDEPIEFHRRVREGFRRLAARNGERVRLVDASGDPDAVFRLLLGCLPEELR